MHFFDQSRATQDLATTFKPIFTQITSGNIADLDRPYRSLFIDLAVDIDAIDVKV